MHVKKKKIMYLPDQLDAFSRIDHTSKKHIKIIIPIDVL